VASDDRSGRPVVAVWRNAVRDSPLDTTAKAVALVLSTYMNNLGAAFPSKRTLAAGASLSSTRSVDAAINRVEAAGLLEIVRSRGHRSNSYLAIVPADRLQEAARREHDELAYLDA
jgi:hypothetical protein